MIEIVCPNCQARYQLPDGAIGPDGRKVSCSSCAHKWRAHPEEPATAETPASAAPPATEAPPPAAPAPAPVPAAPAASETAAQESAAQEPPAQESVASGPAAEMDDEDTSAPPPNAPPPATGNRDEQMAAIRKMLSDLKEAADTGSEDAEDAAAARAAAAATAAGVGPSAKRRDDEAPNRNRLEDRIDDVDKLAKMVKGEPTGDGYDATRLRKRHEKRAKRLQRARERKKRSGAFLTGFTLVAVVATVMVGLYVMHPRIIAASPELEPALTEYVNTVDRYRVEFAATTEEWKAWLTERIGNLQKQADEQG